MKLEPEENTNFDLVTRTVLRHLPKKSANKLMYLFNAAYRFKYVFEHCKVAVVIIIPEPG